MGIKGILPWGFHFQERHGTSPIHIIVHGDKALEAVLQMLLPSPKRICISLRVTGVRKLHPKPSQQMKSSPLRGDGKYLSIFKRVWDSSNPLQQPDFDKDQSHAKWAARRAISMDRHEIS
eukprot:scaffold25497_cov68-Cyclotella_meneghiniana.AAC.4